MQLKIFWHYGGCLNKRAARLRLAVQAPATNKTTKRNSKAHGNGRSPLKRVYPKSTRYIGIRDDGRRNILYLIQIRE